MCKNASACSQEQGLLWGNHCVALAGQFLCILTQQLVFLLKQVRG